MVSKNPVADDIQDFFTQVFELKEAVNYRYADYKDTWLRGLGLSHNYARESATAQTTKRLQTFLEGKYKGRIRTEVPVAENMSLRFLTHLAEQDMPDVREEKIDFRKFQAFDVLDLETNTAFEISLSDAFAEFFKDLLKALLDSRVKTLYFCARNHKYLGSKKSGFIKVRDSSMVQQYIALAKLYKLDVILFDLFPRSNE